MTVVTQTPAANSGVNKIWRKVQGDIADGLNFECEEMGLLKRTKRAKFDWSLREVTAPVDIIEGGGIASIDESAYEAVASSPNAQEITVSPVFFNGRFEASRLVQYIDQHGGETQIRDELVHKGLHKVRAMCRHISDYFYGFSTGVLALTDTDLDTILTQTLTLKSGYSRTDITTASFIADKFRVGDRVAIIDSDTQKGVGAISAISKTTPSLTIVFDAAPTAVTTNGLKVVKANSLDNTVSDYNRGLVGLADTCFSTSVHGLSSSTEANWSVAGSDANGGRLTGVRLHAAIDEIKNYGDADAKVKVILDQGVYRDMVSLYQAGVRFNDSMSLQPDGELEGGDKMWFKSRRVPPGYAIVADMSGMEKWMLLPGDPANQGTVRWADGRPREDRAATVFKIDVPMQLITRNRKKFYPFTALTRS